MKKVLAVVAALAFAVSLNADDNGNGATKPARIRQGVVTTKVVRRSQSQPEKSAHPIDRELEVRLGPRVTFAGGTGRIGPSGNEFAIWEDLGMDEPGYGAMFNIDYQPNFLKNFHAQLDMTWDKIDHAGVTARAFSNGNQILDSGAATAVNADVYTLALKLGYDVFKNDTFRIRPYLGGIAAYITGNSSYQGNVRNSAGVLIGPDNRSKNFDQAEVSFLAGIDNRLYVARDWYAGIDFGGMGADRFYFLTGQVYSGYDFTKNFGVRLGYDAKYGVGLIPATTVIPDWGRSEHQGKLDPLLGAAYVQALWGF